MASATNKDGDKSAVAPAPQIFTRQSTRKVTLFRSETGSNRLLKQKQQSGTNTLSHDDAIDEKADSVDTEKIEKVNVETIDPTDLDMIDNVLRDSLIKAFMVIFTNEQSQHLLLNKDLIDIAFNCLEYCSECTLEAKRHVARLISIIFKFP